MNNLNKQFKIFEIIENATIIYTDDISEFFDAIRIIDRGVIIGRILKSEIYTKDSFKQSKEKTGNNYSEEFVECGFISNNSIKKIKNGIKRRITISID